MSELLRKKSVRIFIGVIVILLLIIIFLLLLRHNPAQQTTITREEYLRLKADGGNTVNETDLLPKIGAEKIKSEALNSLSGQAAGEEATPKISATRALGFFAQIATLPFSLVGNTLSGSVCQKDGKTVCSSPEAMLVVKDSSVSDVTLWGQVLQIPESIMDQLQDIYFYRFISLLQQNLVTSSAYPSQDEPTSLSWLSQLVANGEMSQLYLDVFTRSNSQARNCGSRQQSGFCYESDGKEALLYVRVRAGTAECPHGAIKTWDGKKNSLQLTCFAK